MENKLEQEQNNTAFLSNERKYTIFSFGENRLKFIAPYS